MQFGRAERTGGHGQDDGRHGTVGAASASNCDAVLAALVSAAGAALPAVARAESPAIDAPVLPAGHFTAYVLMYHTRPDGSDHGEADALG